MSSKTIYRFRYDCCILTFTPTSPWCTRLAAAAFPLFANSRTIEIEIEVGSSTARGLCSTLMIAHGEADFFFLVSDPFLQFSKLILLNCEGILESISPRSRGALMLRKGYKENEKCRSPVTGLAAPTVTTWRQRKRSPGPGQCLQSGPKLHCEKVLVEMRELSCLVFAWFINSSLEAGASSCLRFKLL